MWSRTSSRVIRPPGPEPVIASGSRPCSLTSRRTTGDSRRLSPAWAVSAAGAAAAGGVDAGAAGAGGAGGGGGVDAAGAGSGAAGGAGAGSGAGAGVDSGSAAGAAGASPSASPTTAITVPTSTVSPSCTRISVSTPATGDGTSVSTLSVDTSNNGSSSATVSPTFLNHWVIVPSVTVSPSCGSVTSAMVVSLLLVSNGSCRIGDGQPLKLRPVSVITVSPNSSERLGCGWRNSAISSTEASQLTAR